MTCVFDKYKRHHTSVAWHVLDKYKRHHTSIAWHVLDKYKRHHTSVAWHPPHASYMNVITPHPTPPHPTPPHPTPPLPPLGEPPPPRVYIYIHICICTSIQHTCIIIYIYTKSMSLFAGLLARILPKKNPQLAQKGDGWLIRTAWKTYQLEATEEIMWGGRPLTTFLVW